MKLKPLIEGKELKPLDYLYLKTCSKKMWNVDVDVEDSCYVWSAESSRPWAIWNAQKQMDEMSSPCIFCNEVNDSRLFHFCSDVCQREFVKMWFESYNPNNTTTANDSSAKYDFDEDFFINIEKPGTFISHKVYRCYCLFVLEVNHAYSLHSLWN